VKSKIEDMMFPPISHRLSDKDFGKARGQSE